MKVKISDIHSAKLIDQLGIYQQNGEFEIDTLKLITRNGCPSLVGIRKGRFIFHISGSDHAQSILKEITK